MVVVAHNDEGVELDLVHLAVPCQEGTNPLMERAIVNKPKTRLHSTGGYEVGLFGGFYPVMSHSAARSRMWLPL